jgi:hypothetical protein
VGSGSVSLAFAEAVGPSAACIVAEATGSDLVRGAVNAGFASVGERVHASAKARADPKKQHARQGRLGIRSDE